MIPSEPTRDDAAGVRRPEEMDEPAPSPGQGAETPHALGEGRQPRGGAADNQRHPPHVTENSEGAPLQDEQDRPREIEPLPANASGHERIDSADVPQEIDRESMYDRRPGEDKDDPPSSRAD